MLYYKTILFNYFKIVRVKWKGASGRVYRRLRLVQTDHVDHFDFLIRNITMVFRVIGGRVTRSKLWIHALNINLEDRNNFSKSRINPKKLKHLEEPDNMIPNIWIQAPKMFFGAVEPTQWSKRRTLKRLCGVNPRFLKWACRVLQDGEYTFFDVWFSNNLIFWYWPIESFINFCNLRFRIYQRGRDKWTDFAWSFAANRKRSRSLDSILIDNF